MPRLTLAARPHLCGQATRTPPRGPRRRPLRSCTPRDPPASFSAPCRTATVPSACVVSSLARKRLAGGARARDEQEPPPDLDRHRPRLPGGLTLRARCRPDPYGTPAVLTITLRPGTPARSRAVCDGAATAAYDRRGRLLSVEVKARVRLDLLAAVARKEGPAVGRFLGQCVPPALVRFS
jgi:hypothetical protein